MSSRRAFMPRKAPSSPSRPPACRFSAAGIPATACPISSRSTSSASSARPTGSWGREGIRLPPSLGCGSGAGDLHVTFQDAFQQIYWRLTNVPEIERFEAAFTGRAQTHVLSLFGQSPWGYREPEMLAEMDLVYVGGGSTVNLLALWRTHGVDDVLRRAAATGTILAGISAGGMPVPVFSCG